MSTIEQTVEDKQIVVKGIGVFDGQKKRAEK
jgi:hypothetical protein